MVWEATVRLSAGAPQEVWQPSVCKEWLRHSSKLEVPTPPSSQSLPCLLADHFSSPPFPIPTAWISCASLSSVQADRTGGLETALKAMNSLRGVVTLVRGKGGGGGEEGRGGCGEEAGEGKRVRREGKEARSARNGTLDTVTNKGEICEERGKKDQAMKNDMLV